MKKALITGVTGQDGAYLSEFLLKKGYEVHGVKRRSSSFNTARIDHLFCDKHESLQNSFFLHFGDCTDSSNIIRLIQEIQPDEIYNLAAQSHVAVSFETPEYTAQADGLGLLRILEAISISKWENKVRIYQASTSELFGEAQEVPQTELTPFCPRSPYAVAKLYAYWIGVNYRQAYGMFVSNGILFNHESPLRGETFVTRKITRAAVRIANNYQKALYLGNLDARRDWGHAIDYVDAMWRILQHEKADDFVIATGVMHSVREFVEVAFECVGIPISWKGSGIDEIGINALNGSPVVFVDSNYFRPTDVSQLCGNARKAHEILGWKPKIVFNDLVAQMIESDQKAFCKEQLFDRQGQPTFCYKKSGLICEISY